MVKLPQVRFDDDIDYDCLQRLNNVVDWEKQASASPPPPPRDGRAAAEAVAF